MTSDESEYFTVEDLENVTVITFTDPIFLYKDRSIIPAFDRLFARVNEKGMQHMLLDFTQTTSYARNLIQLALGRLVTLNKKLTTKGARLGFCGLTAEIEEVIRQSHLQVLFLLYPTPLAALDAMPWPPIPQPSTRDPQREEKEKEPLPPPWRAS